MKYQFRDKKKIENKKQFFKIVIVSFIIFLLILTGIASRSGGFFNFIGKPLWKIKNSFLNTIFSSGYLIKTKKSVFIENEELEKKINEQNLAMVDYQILKSENEELKSLFGRVTKNNLFILANILVKPSQSPYDTLIIDIGNDYGFKKGDKVFVNKEIPIGYISNIYEHTSLVSLYSNPGERTEAMIQGLNSTVELIGRGGGNFEITIPIDLLIDKGTRVVFPGISSEVIAITEDVISSPTDPVKKVLLRSPVNIQQLKWVQVER